MELTESVVRDALSEVIFPGFDRDIVSLRVLTALSIDGGRIRVTIDPGPRGAAHLPALHDAIRRKLGSLPGVEGIDLLDGGDRRGSSSLPIAGQTPSVAAAGGLERGLLPDVRHVIAVASGKGGVGKSTVAVNLAVSLARAGRRVGLLDADIYGPSIPTMMGVDEPPRLTEERRLLPFERHGVRLMSLGLLIDDRDTAVIWRGPMVIKALQQLLSDVLWGPLDVLVVDMPPGTGDAQLTMSQKVDLAGALIVTTPQDVALVDAIKGIAMFRKVGVPLLGLVENMSYFQCSHCNERTAIFGTGGGRREAERLEVPFLGELPLDPDVRRGGDAGQPIAALDADTPIAAAFVELARRIDEQLESAAEGSAPRGSLLERFKNGWSDRG